MTPSLWFACLGSLMFNSVFAQSISPIPSFSNITTPRYTNPSLTITSSVPVTSASNSTNSTCPGCALFLGPSVLQQVVWYDKTLSLTLDTVSIQVTSYPGNLSAVTNTITRYGDLNTVDYRNVSAAMALSSSVIQFAVAEYGGGGDIFFASGTDGTLDGATSLAWPTPYVRVSSVMSYTTTAYSACPSGQQFAGLVDRLCGCAFRTDVNFITLGGDGGVSEKNIPLDANYYYPVSTDLFNLTGIDAHAYNEFAALDVSSFSVWLVQQPWATVAIPNIDSCLFAGAPQGPPALKVPVTALTASVTTTVQGVGSPSSPAAQPASKSSFAGAAQTDPPSPMNIPPAPHPHPDSASPQPAAPKGGQGGNEINPQPSVPSGDQNSGNLVPQPAAPGELESGGNNINSHPTSPAGSQNGVGQSGAGENGGNAIEPQPANPGVSPNGGGQDGGGESGVQQPTTPNGGESEVSVRPQPAVPGGSGTGGNPQPAAPQGGQNGDIGINPQPANVPHEATAASPIATVGNQVVNFHPSKSAIVIGGGILSQGSPAVMAGSTQISVGQSGIVIGQSTVPLPLAAPSSVFTAAGHTITSSAGGLFIGGSSIISGAAGVTIANTPISLGNSGLIVGTSAIALPAPSPTFSIFTVDGQTSAAIPDGVIVPGNTIKPGSPAQTVANTPISLGDSGLVIGSSTIALPTPPPNPTFPIPAFTVGGHTFIAQSGGVVISGQTLSAGGSPLTLSGTKISAGASSVIVGSSTAIIPSAILSSSTFVVGDQIFTAESNGGVAISGSSVQTGGSPITVAGTRISLGSSGLVVGSSTIQVPKVAASNTFVVGGQTFASNANGIAISGKTLQGGESPITVDGNQISLGPAGLVVGSSTIAIPTINPSFTTSSTFVVGSQTFTANGNGIVVSGTTLHIGSNPITISGTPISFGPAGLVVGTSTVPFPTAAPSPTTFVLGGKTFSANPTAIVISGTSITEGASAITVSGTEISLGISGLVIGSSTYGLPSSLPSSVLTIDGETFTINPTAIEISGTTLSEGQAITISGTPISLGTDGLVIGSSTVRYKGGPLTQTSEGIGGAIIAGFGPSPTAPTPTVTSPTQPFLGGAGKSGGQPSLLSILGSTTLGWMVIRILT